MIARNAVHRLMTMAVVAVVALLPAAPASAEPFRAQVAGWIERIEARAAELDAAPAPTVPAIEPGTTLKKGSAGPRVEVLVRRLIELGYLPAGHQTESFDDTVADAVRAFQTAERLTPDGKVGTGTRIALNRTPAESARLMRSSATAMRSFLANAPDDVLLVNLPSQTVTLVRKGEEQFSMRAVVGRPSRSTPLLEDRITHVIVNPDWVVPPTVMKLDKLPNLQRTGTPGVSHAIVYLDGEEVAPETVDWTSVSPWRIRIVQTPGDHNALGRFRFNLTNSESIYLHGTNEPHLFGRDVRTVSSGCVRLQEARQLAEVLLADVGIGSERIDRMLESGTKQWVKLKTPMPVKFLYWTATVDPDGTVRLHPDIYDRVEDVVTAASRA